MRLDRACWRGLASFPALCAMARKSIAAGLHPKKPKRGWSAAEVRHVLDSAVRLAGIHEATYLAFCQQSKEMR